MIDVPPEFYIITGVVVVIGFSANVLWDYLSRRKSHPKTRAHGKT